MTTKDIEALIVSFRDATQFWIVSLNSEKISQVRAASVAKPLNELSSLVKLLRAHTTKVGIIFEPERLKKEPATAYSTLEKLSESLILTVSLIAQLKLQDISQLYYDEIVIQVVQLIESNHELAKELLLIYEAAEKNEGESKQSKSGSENENSGVENGNGNGNGNGEGRLVYVGKIWSNCDSLSKLLSEGALGLLTLKVKQSIDLIDDGFEEFVEWAENPEDMGDPFGFSDDDDDEEEEEEEETAATAEYDDVKGKVPSSTGYELEKDEEKSSETGLSDNDELSAYAKKWQKKIELVRLLLASFKKSLPKTTASNQIDKIYDIQKSLVTSIDKLIVELMMNGEISDEVESIADDISKSSTKLAKLAESIHKDDTKKTSWYSTWITKYDS